MKNERRWRADSPEFRAVVERIDAVMEMTSRLNLLPYSAADERRALLVEIFGCPLPHKVTIKPPFFTDYGLNIDLGDRVFVNQGCSFLDLGGIRVGDRSLIGPGVTLATAGHPIELPDRYEYVTAAPIVIEEDVWIGAAATVAPGVTIGRGSVIGAGAVVARDVPPLTVVTGQSFTTRRRISDQANTAGPGR